MKLRLIHIVLFLTSVITVQSGLGQTSLSMDQLDPDTFRFSVGTRWDGLVNSNAITGAMQYAMIRNLYIDRDTRNKMLDRASVNNRYGLVTTGSVFFAHAIDSLFGKDVKLNYFVQIADRQENNSIYSADMLNLLLFGNASYAGKTAVMNDFSLLNLRYQQYQFGFLASIDTIHTIGFGAAFLSGEQFIRAETSDFSLFTSETGDLLRLQIQGEANMSDTGNTGFLKYNGWGLSLDLFYRVKFNFTPNRENGGYFKAELNDLGFIKWHGTSEKLRFDTIYDYSGIEIDNIFDPAGNDYSPGNILDSISTTEKSEYTLYIPATLRMEIGHNFGKGRFALGGFYRFNANFSPYFYGKAGIQFNDFLGANAIINYGGYGSFGMGMELMIDAGDFHIAAGSWNLEGILFPRSAGGQQLYFMVNFDF